jgi:hypothetical protein
MIPDSLGLDRMPAAGIESNFGRLNGESPMKDIEDIELKAEMDEIMRSVESIMKKVEAVLPPRSQAPDPSEE